MAHSTNHVPRHLLLINVVPGTPRGFPNEQRSSQGVHLHTCQDWQYCIARPTTLESNNIALGNDTLFEHTSWGIATSLGLGCQVGPEDAVVEMTTTVELNDLAILNGT